MPFHCCTLHRCRVSLQDSSPAGQEWTQLLDEALTLSVTQPRRNQHPPMCGFESHASPISLPSGTLLEKTAKAGSCWANSASGTSRWL